MITAHEHFYSYLFTHSPHGRTVIPALFLVIFMTPTEDPRDSPEGGRQSHHTPQELFSPSRAGHLDTHLRRLIYRPDHLAERYVKPGDLVLDFGCGPGFFTRAFAKRTGETGSVIAVDLQEEMLQILQGKLGQEGLMTRIRTHRCAPDSLRLSPDLDGKINIAFAMFVIHEVPDPARLFREISTLLVPGGHFFISDPIFIVSSQHFQDYVAMAGDAGLIPVERGFYFLNRAALLKKA